MDFVATPATITSLGSTGFVRIAEVVQYDPSDTEGLYLTADEAVLDSMGIPNVNIYPFDGRFTYNTPPDLSVVCIRPNDLPVYPEAGYLSGG